MLVVDVEEQCLSFQRFHFAKLGVHLDELVVVQDIYLEFVAESIHLHQRLPCVVEEQLERIFELYEARCDTFTGAKFEIVHALDDQFLSTSQPFSPCCCYLRNVHQPLQC